MAGTPGYMAPEQITMPASVDHRADIYSTGVVFYEMLAGELPKADRLPPSRKAMTDPRLDPIIFHAIEWRTRTPIPRSPANAVGNYRRGPNAGIDHSPRKTH